MNWQLKKEIVEKFGSQFRFAHKVGIPEAVISKVVRGRFVLPKDKALLCADALGVDPSLFGMNKKDN